MHDEIDFDAMDVRLADVKSSSPNSPPSDLTDEQLAWLLASRALAELLQGIIPHGPTLNPHALGCRLLAVLHEIDPSLVGGRSLWSIANEIGMSRANLSRIAVQLRDRVGTSGIKGHSITARQREAMRARLIHKGQWQTSITHQRRVIMQRTTK